MHMKVYPAQPILILDRQSNNPSQAAADGPKRKQGFRLGLFLIVS